MNTKHTPGPWEMVQIGADAGQINIRHATETGTSYVARIWDIQLCEEHGDFKANARLIAAAPELLQELSRVVSWFEQFQHAQRVGGDMLELLQNVDLRDAKSAIARATGE